MAPLEQAPNSFYEVVDSYPIVDRWDRFRVYRPQVYYHAIRARWLRDHETATIPGALRVLENPNSNQLSYMLLKEPLGMFGQLELFIEHRYLVRQFDLMDIGVRVSEVVFVGPKGLMFPDY